jgi:hypothetical protein
MSQTVNKPPNRKRSPTPGRGRVFVIGAGVSASCGIAVANQILREAVMRMEDTDSAKTSRIHDLLRYLYPNFEIRLRNYPNIEDFLNLLEMAKRFNSEEFITSSLWSVRRLNEVKRHTLRAVTDYLWDRMADKRKQQNISEFANGNLREGDTIITFNWDLTLERALEEYRGDPGFLYTYSDKREEKHFTLLKPHGSIDWFAKKAVHGLVPEKNLGTLDDQLCYYPRFNRADHPRLLEVPPVIVPPVALKQFGFDFLKRTWRFVYRAISRAKELYMIGYSLPREDQFARLVFRRAIRNNILKARTRSAQPVRVEVINPDPLTEITFSHLVGSEVKDFNFHQACFEDYVAGLQE